LSPADILDSDLRHRLGKSLFALQKIFLNLRKIGLLATKVDQNDATDIRMIGIVGQCPQHHFNRRTILTTTPLVVRDGHYAVAVWVFLALELRELGDTEDLFAS